MDRKGWGRKDPALFHAHNTSRGRAGYFHTLMGVHYQPLVWANVVFDREDPQGEVRYKCERCGEVLGEYQWKQAARRGRFVAENPGAEARGFHLNTLASTFCGWKEIVQKFLVAKEQLDQGNPEGMKVWVNTELGETWEEQGEVVEDAELLGRRELYEADVPDGVLVLTAGIDVQDDRFEVEVVGWGVGKESWGIRYQKIFGDLLKEQVWADLDAFLLAGFQKKDGTVLHITVDNGSEFSAAEEMERSAVNKTIPRTKVYFCHPYSSWERGSNENANIMIRRKHPKGTDFNKVSPAQVAATEAWINNYPRKILGYRSSEVVFRECLRELGITA